MLKCWHSSRFSWFMVGLGWWTMRKLPTTAAFTSINPSGTRRILRMCGSPSKGFPRRSWTFNVCDSILFAASKFPQDKKTNETEIRRKSALALFESMQSNLSNENNKNVVMHAQSNEFSLSSSFFSKRKIYGKHILSIATPFVPLIPHRTASVHMCLFLCVCGRIIYMIYILFDMRKCI